MKFYLLLLFILIQTQVKSATFYAGHEIPVFNKSEEVIFENFGISFKKLTLAVKIETHNSEVLELIEHHGDHWRDSLLTALKNEREEVQTFVRYLCANTGFDISDRRSVLIAYHWNGIIARRQLTIRLRHNGGDIYHRKVKSQFWNKKGEKLKPEKRVEKGSGL